MPFTRRRWNSAGTDEGAPGPRGDQFYAGYFRDLDGNKLNAFCMTRTKTADDRHGDLQAVHGDARADVRGLGAHVRDDGSATWLRNASRSEDDDARTAMGCYRRTSTTRHTTCRNLFELPVAFYALCLMLYVTDTVNHVHVRRRVGVLRSFEHCTVSCTARSIA